MILILIAVIIIIIIMVIIIMVTIIIVVIIIMVIIIILIIIIMVTIIIVVLIIMEQLFQNSVEESVGTGGYGRMIPRQRKELSSCYSLPAMLIYHQKDSHPTA